MNHEQQNTAIAEACGWTKFDVELCLPSRASQHGFQTYKGIDTRPILMHPPNAPFNSAEGIPDSFNDLNAMAHARDVLIATPELKIKWVNKLRDVVGLTATRRNKLGQPIVSDIDLLFATAQQLAQALLQTLNLWKDV